ncbi:uncharacterized acetyltransferase At3g50280-like [Spinacia oleracea]|uniref:Uncharacterized acetyltransferase At3g50280-like n=1 Tax=Spinacia oleracea TaxID=3562 RepID=A0ABM3RGM0_SPIOL|nr:uncharacterized acetyltransferase At3g50280-like [Spinacia oleracea]
MARLKGIANQQCGDDHNALSSFQALAAFVWRSITRARDLPKDEQTTCSVVMGTRSRLNPPVSEDVFGNFVRKAQWACDVDELLGNDLGRAALNIRKCIMAIDGEAILDFYKKLSNSPMVVRRGLIEPEPYWGSNSVIIGGSTRFNTYGPEFGFGRALTVRTGYGNKKDGKIVANPGCEGGGSVDLEICLRPHIMAALESNQEFMNFVS